MISGPKSNRSLRRGRRFAAIVTLSIGAVAATASDAVAQRPPDPPEDLEAEAVSASRIDLTWERGSGGATPVLYRVYRDGSRVDSTTQRTYSDTGLQPSTQYTYFVTAVDAKNREGDPSATATATTFADDTPPTVPSSLTATPVSPTRVDLSWSPAQDPQSGVSEYRVYRDGGLIGSSSTTSFEDTNLQPYTLYEYRVSAVNGSGLEGGRSAPSSARTLDGSPPTIPQGLSATAISSRRIDLAWRASEDPETGVTEYRVYRDGSVIASTPDATYSDGGLQPNTEYEYRVSAVNGQGLESELSDPATVKTLAEADDTPPSVPTNLTAAPVSSTRIDLSWSPAEDLESGVSEYRVYRDGALVGSSSGTAFEDASLEPYTLYEYRVSAVNGDGFESGQSDGTEARTLDETPPTTPTDLSATPVSSRAIDLVWRASEDPEAGVAEYRVYRDGAFVASTPDTMYSDDGLDPETEYEYRVSAVNSEGLESELSDPANVQTPPATDLTPPTAPTGLAASSVTPTQIDLVWTASTDPDTGVDHYRIYRDDVFVGAVVETAWADIGLLPNTTYRYAISAVNGDGLEGPKSDEVTATTPAAADTIPPAPPTGLRVVG